ncbi:response regulator [Salidesulfovibrio onnuriiensis]|uniref:response regulator n=1 Tax=Salidesulfovibrio onnuriiensis TaxID=2583823 RepID=UPI0011CCB215|nr:response regulator [Salidesulfovibrio onnuriiensis]
MRRKERTKNVYVVKSSAEDMEDIKKRKDAESKNLYLLKAEDQAVNKYSEAVWDFVDTGGLFIVLSEDKTFYVNFRNSFYKELEIEMERVRLVGSTDRAKQEIQVYLDYQKKPFLFMDSVVGGVSTLPFLEKFKVEFPETFVVVLSTEADKGTLARFMEAGADNFIIKPASVNVLIEKIAFTIFPQDAIEKKIREAKHRLRRVEFALAYGVARDILKIKKGSPAALMIMGDALKGLDRRKDALECYEAAALNAPAYLAPLKKLVEFYREDENEDKILEYLIQLDEHSPLLFERKKEIGETLLRRGVYDEAGKYLAGAVTLAGAQHYEDAPFIAEEYADAVADHCPEHAARIYKDCIKYRKLARLDMDTTYYNRLGRALRRIGRWQDAVMAYMEGAKYNREDASLYFNTGMAYVEGKEYSKAGQVMKKVTELSPFFHTEDIQIAYNMGMIFNKAGYNELALKMFDFVCGRDPEYKNADKLMKALKAKVKKKK